MLWEVDESFKIVEFLVKGNSEADCYNRKGNPFWRFLISTQSQFALMKIYILFDVDGHYSVPTLLKLLRCESEFHGIIPDVKITLWENGVQQNIGDYKKVKIRRNQQITHRDKNPSKKDLSIKFDELKELIDLVQKIASDIHCEIFGYHYIKDWKLGLPVQQLGKIIQELDSNRRAFLMPLFEEVKKQGLNEELPPSERNK